MSTPTKRRKTNGYRSSPQTTGSLDFFFGKQKAEFDSKAREDNAGNNPVDPEAQSKDQDVHKVENQTLTDEELAMKLQLEWDQQDKSPSANAHDKLKYASSDSAFLSQNEHLKELNDGVLSYRASTLGTTSTADNMGSQAENKATINPENKATLSLQSAASAEDAVSSTVPFDASPLTFKPVEYISALKEHWAKEDGDASYGLLTRCFIMINSTQSRIKIVDTLVNFLRIIIEGDPASLLPAVSGCKPSPPNL